MEILLPYKNVVTNQRNYTMDVLKAIFAICVILVHFPFPGDIGTVFSTIGIVGVIFFFLISGYNAYDINDDEACKKILNRFKRNLKITLIVVGIYLVLMTLEALVAGYFDEYLDYYTNPWLVPRIILLGDFSFIKADQLWFMVALLYAYLTLYLLHKFKIAKYSYYALPILLMLRIGIETYVNTAPGADWHYACFFIGSSLPVMLLGHYIRAKKEAFLKAPIYVTIILTVIATALMYATVYINVFDINCAQFFKIWCAFELFILALKLPGKKEVPVIGLIGRKYSLYIYLFHFLIGVIVMDIFYLVESPEWVIDWIAKIVVVIFAIIVSIGMYKLNNLIKNKLKNRNHA